MGWRETGCEQGAQHPDRLWDGKLDFLGRFSGFMSFQASLYLRSLIGIGGIIAAFGFFSVLTRRYFKGSLGEDFKSMFRARKLRVLIWLALIAGLLAIPIQDRAGGEFHVRPVVRREGARTDRRFPP